LFAPFCLAWEGVAVLLAALASWAVLSLLPGADPAPLATHALIGVAAAGVAVILTILRNEYGIGFYVAGQNTAERTLHVWNATVFALLAIPFLLGATDRLPRDSLVLLYPTGFLALWGARRLITRALREASRRKLVLPQRILLVGTERSVTEYLRRARPSAIGIEVVGAASVTPVMRGEPGGRARVTGELRPAVEFARRLRPHEVYVALPWSEIETIDLCVEAFLNTPVAIHLTPERLLDRFERISIARVGGMASLELTRPMPALGAIAKRSLDAALAVAALALLAPLLALVSIVIKLDSPGPVLFRQTRYGFNQRPFRIYKFRSMTTYVDGEIVPQATAGDARVTRVGRFLRRSNLDELPQLLNVVAGDMSLVGPRPHAVPHNRAYEDRIALYARRHNVRPGITGWAQVNGFRGETDTEDKMRARVAHDLFYIDNWSLILDLRIMARTIFSPKAYQNAV
jgi:Undecaprenyl-phosphate glucose phosphotransferase